MMKRMTVCFALLCLWAVPAYGATEIGNTEELIKYLTTGQQAAKLEKAGSERGCRPDYCSIDIDGISILHQLGKFQRQDGKPITLIAHAPGDESKLPAMDLDINEGYKVIIAGKRWGTCFNFSHTGIGKSGSFQRWSSVVLVPWKKSKPGPAAHRFVGYWADCEMLSEGGQEGEIKLPIVEPVEIGSTKIHLVWFHCKKDHCRKVTDERNVEINSQSATGELLISAPVQK